MFVVGCSSLKFAYGFVKTVVRERVEAYLDIGENDVFALESEISKLVSWHRAEMLPQYAVFLLSKNSLSKLPSLTCKMNILSSQSFCTFCFVFTVNKHTCIYNVHFMSWSQNTAGTN